MMYRFPRNYYVKTEILIRQTVREIAATCIITFSGGNVKNKERRELFNVFISLGRLVPLITRGAGIVKGTYR
jgi:hypothetical protein